MAELDLSPAARADLVDIRIFSLEQFGAKVADRYYLGFDEAFTLLAVHPFAGSARPEFGETIRCFVHRRHRILYRIEAGVVVIIRVLHHSVDTRRILKG